jgi:hypothetical protein
MTPNRPRYMTAGGRCWRIKPLLTQEEFFHSQASREYATYETYGSHALLLNEYLMRPENRDLLLQTMGLRRR